MKLIAFIIISILTYTSTGQEKVLKGKAEIDSVISKTKKPENVAINAPVEIQYIDINTSEIQPAYFIDGEHYSETIIKTINPRMIDSVSVVKEEITIEDKKYYGLIHIKMKADYKLEIISLTDLKIKYIKPDSIPSIFIIDNDIIKSDYDKFIVDEKYILKIKVQRVNIQKENLNINVIQLITKTKENFKKANEIKIRGFESTMSG